MRYRLSCILLALFIVLVNPITVFASETVENIQTDMPTANARIVEIETDNISDDETVLTDDTLQTDEITEESAISEDKLNDIYNVLMYMLGIMIFFVVVLLCKYSYKFFNMFF